MEENVKMEEFEPVKPFDTDIKWSPAWQKLFALKDELIRPKLPSLKRLAEELNKMEK